jgi:hypothetical protein
MNRPTTLLLALLAATLPVGAQAQGAEEIIVTGSRIQARHIPATSLKRHADFLLLHVEVSNDSRGYRTRRDEILGTLRAMLTAAGKDRSIELSVIRDDNVVVPLKLDDETLDFSSSSDPTGDANGRLATTLSVKIPIPPETTNGAALVGKLKQFIESIEPVGRTQVVDDEETQVSVVNVAQYREPVLRLFAEDVKRITTGLGGDYRIVARGLDQPIQWVRDGTLGVVIYVPYQFDLVPTTLSSYVSGPIAVRDADD